MRRSLLTKRQSLSPDKTSTGTFRCSLASLSDGAVTQVTHLTAKEGRAQVPAFSADGRQLAFQVNRAGNSDIWIINRDGSSPVALVASSTELNEVPAWFPASQAIAFQSNRTGRMEIWIAPVAGGAPRQLTGR